MDLRTYGDALKTRRVIHLTGTVDEAMLKVLRTQRDDIFKASAPAEIIVTLTTPGGDVDWGYAISDELEAIGCATSMRLLCLGNVCSMGVVIAMAVPRERRFASRNAVFYVHRGDLTFGGRTSGGPEEQDYAMLERAARLAFCKERHAASLRCIADGTGLSLEGVTALFDHPEYLTATKSLEKGFVSGIVL
ncbi:ATP-dependent Clp protease proteolytic subunit [Patescibacteria group bacterium]|nr:ATP-dependent Clp protease proteolytic subunit [Patescibacteria group bacterium]